MYKTDRRYTDSKHKVVARTCYPKSLVEVQLPEYVKKDIDVNDAIDYFCVSKKSGKTFYIQERIRRPGYRDFTDFTIRYKRTMMYSDDPIAETEWEKLCRYMENHSSEDFHFWIVYAFVDDDGKVTKFVIADLRKIVSLYEEGKIVIKDKQFGCNVRDGVLYVGTNHVDEAFRNQSQHFLAIDVPMLMEVCPEAVVKQMNYTK